MTIGVDRNNDFHNAVLFRIGGNLYMIYNLNNRNLYCDYGKIVKILVEKYECNAIKIENLIRDKLSKHFKINE